MPVLPSRGVCSLLCSKHPSTTPRKGWWSLLGGRWELLGGTGPWSTWHTGKHICSNQWSSCGANLKGLPVYCALVHCMAAGDFLLSMMPEAMILPSCKMLSRLDSSAKVLMHMYTKQASHASSFNHCCHHIGWVTPMIPGCINLCIIVSPDHVRRCQCSVCVYLPNGTVYSQYDCPTAHVVTGTLTASVYSCHLHVACINIGTEDNFTQQAEMMSELFVHPLIVFPASLNKSVIPSWSEARHFELPKVGYISLTLQVNSAIIVHL